MYCILEPIMSEVLGSIVVSIPACHAGDPGSIPGRGAFFFFFFFFFSFSSFYAHNIHIFNVTYM